MTNSSQAGPALAEEAMKPASLKLILSYTVEDRRHESEPTLYRRRQGDKPERSSTESDD
jgi:hypothetical protein